jgi:hypothetical protein
VTREDIVLAHAHNDRIPEVLRAPLSNPLNRWEAGGFIAFLRFYLTIPQLYRLGNEEYNKTLGYEAERCLGTHIKDRSRSLLDLHGNHANSGCPSAAYALAGRHKAMEHAVEDFGNQAGCIVRVNPPIHQLLTAAVSRYRRSRT